MSVAHALLRATSALVPTLGGGHGAMRERFCPLLHTLSVWVLIAASLTFTRRTDGYSLLGICMAACLRLNTRLRITCRPGGPSSGWIVTLTGRSGNLGFFRMSPSPRSSLLPCGAFAIMANHVHVLLLPRVPPSRLLQSLKGYTAYQANRCWGEPVSRSGSGNLTTTGSETKKSGAALRPILRTIR